jgi:hypothetical protein
MSGIKLTRRQATAIAAIAMDDDAISVESRPDHGRVEATFTGRKSMTVVIETDGTIRSAAEQEAICGFWRNDQ